MSNANDPVTRTEGLPQNLTVLLSEAELFARVEALADKMAPLLAPDTVGICLLTGGLWFAADLTRALARRGKHLAFDALWLSSYGEGRESAGQVLIRAGLQKPVAGRSVLILDDVFDTGLSLSEAVRLLREAGAREVRSAVFAKKPWPAPRTLEPDFVAWEAPQRFLVGYGLDDAGLWRGLPFIGALD